MLGSDTNHQIFASHPNVSLVCVQGKIKTFIAESVTILQARPEETNLVAKAGAKCHKIVKGHHDDSKYWSRNICIV